MVVELAAESGAAVCPSGTLRAALAESLCPLGHTAAPDSARLSRSAGLNARFQQRLRKR